MQSRYLVHLKGYLVHLKVCQHLGQPLAVGADRQSPRSTRHGPPRVV